MNKKFDINVGIIKFISILFVIMIHLKIYPKAGSGLFTGYVIFLDSIFNIAVTNFFIVSGFFIYDSSKKIKNVYINLIKKIIVNAIIFVCLVSFIFYIIIFFDSSVKQFANLCDFQFIFNINKLPDYFLHLWFIYYFIIIFIFYILNRFIIQKVNIKYIKLVLFIFTLYFFTNDILIFFNDFSINFIYINLIKPIYFSILGFVIYNDFKNKNFKNNNQIIKNKKILFLNFFLFLIFVIFNTLVEYLYQKISIIKFYQYASWYSFNSTVISINFILIILNINFEILKNYNKIYDIIKFINLHIFNIYLYHYIIIYFFKKNYLYNYMIKYIENPITYNIYLVIFTIIVFIMSLFFSLLINKITDLIFFRRNKNAK